MNAPTVSGSAAAILVAQGVWDPKTVELFAQVGQQVEELVRELETQAAALQAVQARLGKTSANSSKPPASDGYAKPKRGPPVCAGPVKSRWGVSRAIGR